MSQNLLFVGDKPLGLSCSKFLSSLKKKYGMKKAGYSGTLDVNAGGNLIIAFGQYTKLFRFLRKTPKRYAAVLWLGAKSETLDIEGLLSVEETRVFEMKEIENAAEKLRAVLTYIPPKYSAKKIDGQRAYDLAREGKEVNLKEVTTEVYELKITRYEHPFIWFEAEVSEGGYIRSIGEMIAKELGVEGCLKELHRLNEGKFFYDDEKPLNPLEFLRIEENFYLGGSDDIALGRVLKKEDFKNQNSGEYFVITDNFLSVFEIKDGLVEYILNKIEL